MIDRPKGGGLDKRDVAVSLAALVVATVVVGGVVGWLASRGEPYDWSTAAVAATAFGTVALAACTGALAWSTNADVSATRELAELTRADQRARETPILYAVEIIIPPDTTLDERGHANGVGFRVVARIENVGPGPAISIELTMTYVGALTVKGQHSQAGFISVLLHGEIWGVGFGWEAEDARSETFNQEDFELEGRCMDTAGTTHVLRHGRRESGSPDVGRGR